MFTRRQLARKEISCGGCTIPGANASTRHLWLWVWDESGTEVVSVYCVMGVALGDQPTLVGRIQAFKTNLLSSRKVIQLINPAPCLSLSFCLIFSEGVPICDRLHWCDDYSIVHPLTLMIHRLAKAQLFYNVPKLIPRAFLGRGRELLWHMDQIWWFVWSWSVDFLHPLPPSSLLRSNQHHIVQLFQSKE